jgi:hypothetical protein
MTKLQEIEAKRNMKTIEETKDCSFKPQTNKRIRKSIKSHNYCSVIVKGERISSPPPEF